MTTQEGQTIPVLHARAGDLVDMIIHRDPLRTLTHMAHTYGDRVQFKLGKQNVYLLSDAEDIREVLVVQQQHFSKVQ